MGGGGAKDYGGGGGGSYISNEDNGIVPVPNTPSKLSREAGFNSNGNAFLVPSTVNLAPIFTVPPGDRVLNFSLTDSYDPIDTSLKAEDFYGNELEVVVESNDVNLGASSDSYKVVYAATDAFGQTVHATRKVTVKQGSNRPTFNLSSLLKIRYPGNQSPAVASNFRANWLGDSDAGFEELDRYEIIANDNPGAFQSGPTIANNGKLTFTPTIGTVQTATLTVIAIDDGPDPSVVESEPQKIEIQINMAPSAPMFAGGTSINFSEDSPSLVVGTVEASDADNPQDLTYTILNSPDKTKLNIDPNSGVLSFKTQPDHDAPNDSNNDRIYEIRVRVGDVNTTAFSDLTVHLQNVPDPPSPPVLSNNEVPENTTTVGTVSSTDPEGTVVTYAISTTNGADRDKFKINSSSGLLEFKSAPDYENPDDFGADRFYSVVVTASSGGHSSSQAFSISVTNAEELPTIPVLSENTIAENKTVVGIVSSSDSDGTPVSYEISTSEGLDRDKFTINSNTGVLAFKVAPNYEDPDDLHEDHIYNLVIISSSGGDTISQAFSIEVIDLNELPTTPNLSNSRIPENETEIGTVSSTDQDGTEVRYEISSTLGIDSDKFQIDPSSGLLKFKSAPDYENPDNAGETDAYEVFVVVSSGGQSISHFFAIEVTNIDEAPSSPVLDNAIVVEGTAFVGTATSTDPEGTAVTFSIAPSPDSASFLIYPTEGYLHFNFDPDFEAPTDQDENNVYEVAIRANSNGQEKISTFFIAVDAVDEKPTDLSLDNTIVIEGSTFVGTATAEDPEGETVTFSLSSLGDSNLFTIDPSNGQLSFLAPPDYEAPLDQRRSNVYRVIVQATSNGQSSSRNFHIQVRKEWFSTIAEFRAAYELAPDGSDDFGDLSNNGVPNIYYHLFGMGDPNGPAQKSTSIGNLLRIPGMPRTARNPDQTVSFFYTTRIDEEAYAVAPQLSSELAEWHLHEVFSDDPNVKFKPIDLSISQIGAHHQQVGLTFLTTATNPEDLAFEYDQLFFRLEIRPLPNE